MFCPRCGVELPDGAAFCPECGERLGGGTVGVERDDSAVPQARAGQRSGSCRPLIAAVAAVAVLAVAGGIWWWLQGRPQERKPISAIASEPEEEPVVEEPVVEEPVVEEPVAEQPVADDPAAGESAPADADVPDLSNPGDLRAVNIFLSNFSESALGYPDGTHAAHFAVSDDATGYERAWLAFNNLAINGGAVEESVLGDGRYYNVRVPAADLEAEEQRLFGTPIDWSTIPSDGMKVVDGYAYTLITNGWNLRGPSAATLVEDAGNGTIRVSFVAYCQLDASLWYEIGDKSQYSLTAEELAAQMGGHTPDYTGSAVLACSRTGEGWSLALVSYDLTPVQ